MNEIKTLNNKFQSSLSLLNPYNKKKGVVLLSGGMDSMALLDAAVRFAPEVQIEGIHFNYQLRGEESLRDETFVKQECFKRSIPLVIERVNIETNNGVQDQARQIRYGRVVELAPKHGWNFALTAHHGDDQIETLLMRIHRGSGLRGLQGIHQKRSIKGLDFLRPFLTLSKDEIREYVQSENLAYVEDSSNLKDKYLRNRVRKKQLPQFKKNLGDYAEKLIAQSIQIQKQMEIFNRQADEYFNDLRSGEYHHIQKDVFRQLDSTVRFLLLERIFNFYGFNKELNECHVLEIERNLETGKNILREYGLVEIFFDAQGIHFTKRQQIALSSQKIKFMEYGSQAWFGEQTIFLRKIKTVDWIGPQKNILSFSSDKLHWPVIIRMPRSGERFRPFGRKGSKKISDFLIEKQVTGLKKSFFPVICDQKSIIGVVGLDISDEYRVDKNTDWVCECYTLII